MKLTVICVFHNQKDHIEPTLTALFEAAADFPFQLLIIDDASTDQSREVIHSLYDYYGHEHTFIFEYDEEHGKGACLNEAAQFASGEIIWTADRITTVDTAQLARQVDALIASKACGMRLHDEPLAEDIETWIERINNGRILSNEHYLWKWNAIPLRDRFFNLYQSDYHGTEMALRISTKCGLIQGEEFFERQRLAGRMAGISSNRTEILMSLFRERKFSVEQADLLMSQLKLKEKKLTVDTSNRSMSELLDEARAYLMEGYNIDALEIVNKLDQKYPDTIEVLQLKVQVLNRLSRFVEASELKFKLQRDHGYSMKIPRVEDRRGNTPRVSGSEDDPRTPAQEAEDARLKNLLTAPPDGSAPPPLPVGEVIPVVVEPVEQPVVLHSEPDEETASVVISTTIIADSEPEPAQDVRQPDPELQETASEDREHIDSASDEYLDEAASEDVAEEFESVDEALSETEDEPPHPDESHLQEEAVPAQPQPPRPRPLVTIIIPTASDRIELLQHCLVSVAEHCDPQQIEIIVVDNASLDDTYEYLQRMEQNEYFRFTVITNKENKGFGFAANQGMDAANGKYVCVLHNDTVFHDDVIGTLTDLMELNSDIDILGPVSNQSLNPKQRPGGISAEDMIAETDYVDSFCMFVRANKELRFDPAYGLAWFDDKDLCNQVLFSGKRVAIAPSAYVEHFMGITVEDYGLDGDCRLFWMNKGYFDEKWDLLPAPGTYFSEDPIEELVAIGININPWRPEPELAARAQKLLSSEVRTRINASTWDYDSLAGIMQLLMVLDLRDLLRHLEDRLTAFEIQEKLCYRLVVYYFERSIYSRCLFYLSEISEDKLSFRLRLLRLRVAVNERKMDVAVPMVTDLMEYSPNNPELIRLTGELHRYDGNYEEAEHYLELARQVDPVKTTSY